MTTSRHVAVRKEMFTEGDIEALACGDLDAIRIKRRADVLKCETLAAQMKRAHRFDRYKLAPKIGKFGIPLFDHVENPARFKEYLKDAAACMWDMREACAPYANPIDEVRLDCDILWPAGARVARLGGHTLSAGLGRVFSPGSFAEPHEDHWDWDVASLGLAKQAKLRAQIAVNLYLEMPVEGGEVLIWPGGLTRDEYERARIPGSYGVRTEALKGEPLVIRPEVGEMVMFASTRTHAVAKGTGGDRVTWSCFIGVRGKDQPLEFWS